MPASSAHQSSLALAVALVAVLGSLLAALARPALAHRALRRRRRRLLAVRPSSGLPSTDGRVSPALRGAAVVLVGLGGAALAPGGPLPRLIAGVCLSGSAVLVVGPGLRWATRPRGEPVDPPGLAALLDLFAACLSSGLPVVDALQESAAATRGPAGDVLAAAAVGLRAGRSGRSAWDSALGSAPSPALRALARACVRAEDGGTPVEGVAALLAVDLREAAAARAQSAAARAGVLAVLPLGLCFLPAYLLLGVVPAVLGLVARLR